MSALLVSNFDLFDSNCAKKTKVTQIQNLATFFIVFPHNFAVNTQMNKKEKGE